MSERGGGGDYDYERRRVDPSFGSERRPTGGGPADEPLIDFEGSGTGRSPRARGGRSVSSERNMARRGRSSPGVRGLYGSRIGSNVLPAAVAELIGTFSLVYTGTAVIVASILQEPLTNRAYDSLAVPLAFGLVLVALVAALGHVSGAHLNPAITLGLAVTRKFPWNFVPAYVGAQVLGAILAAIATWITFGGPGRSEAGLASPAPSPDVGFLQAILIEIFITFILVFVVISVATDDRAPAGTAPIAVGFALAAAIFIGGPASGAAANPARAIGPVIVAWNNWDVLLIYIIGPIIGGILAALLYDRFVSQADAPSQ